MSRFITFCMVMTLVLQAIAVGVVIVAEWQQWPRVANVGIGIYGFSWFFFLIGYAVEWAAEAAEEEKRN